ncbi:hypothetical protein BD847_0349 [Flavobacterium cutihirudinis]|uniref:Uncharacterized protein n=1 Tax=Flavobacterium cutihirudinis TaxID=1265740 RepID=A0A3D9FZN0_9FLAO|nr:hypothetical protein [Flavobacterium cutihirudinis]RED26431.1 hypothetical protein BD847_0349 [Flavobacterium cutihirudinis]
MKQIFIIGLMIITVNSCFGQKAKVDSLLTEFKKKSFYGNVYPAKQELENYQKIIIPELIKLLKDTSFVKLTNTADLIYPGSTTFYGHGHYIPYDMDWVSVRSGWLLEEITFQDFNYKNSAVNDETLLKLMKENYNDYLEKGTYDLDWKNKTSNQKNREYRKILSKNVEKWWKENKKNWSRISAIKEALNSNNENRLSNVFQYLRYGDSKCDKMTKEVYDIEIKPIIISLKETTEYSEIQQQIKLLLNSSISSKIVDSKNSR